MVTFLVYRNLSRIIIAYRRGYHGSQIKFLNGKLCMPYVNYSYKSQRATPTVIHIELSVLSLATYFEARQLDIIGAL